MDYITWQQLKNALNATSDPRLLAEPVLLTVQDAYGRMQAYPCQLLDNTAYQILAAGPAEEEAEYELLVNSEPDFLAETDWRALRQLPPGALLLHYSEMEEDLEEQLQFLEQPNPHTPPPVPVVPGPAPLFD